MTRLKGRALRTVVLALVLLVTGLTGPSVAVSPPRPGSQARAPRSLPVRQHLRPHLDKSSTSVVTALVLPAAFADMAGLASPRDLDGVFTGVGDYWHEASDGRLTIAHEIASWQATPRSASYYTADDNGMDLWGAPHNAGRYVYDAVAGADVDWGRYDNDGPDGVPNSGDDDGVVDALFVVHPGPGGECGGSGLWSHQFFLGGWGYGRFTTDVPRPGGGFVEVDDYVLVPERSCDSGVIEIGVICHEFGHLLGLPDLYDTESSRAGIGGWGLMGTGSWGGDGQQPESPSLPCAWSRHDLGWVDFTDVVQDGSYDRDGLGVRDLDMPVGERWLVEYRPRQGYDRSLPAGGVLIWHIDDSVIDDTRYLNAVNAGPTMGVALEQADGRDDLGTVGGNRGDASDPWPGLANVRRFVGLDNAGRATDVVIDGLDKTPITVVVGVDHLDTTPPTVQLIVPLGGEQWTLGNVHTIAWTANDDEQLGSADLWLSRDGGQTYTKRLAYDLQNTTSWQGSIATEPDQDLRVRVTVRDASGNASIAASGDFALVDRYEPGVALTCPILAGDQLRPGVAVAVSWQAADNVGVSSVDLELSHDDGRTWWPTEHAGLPASAAVTWFVPDRGSAVTRLRAVARDAAGNMGTATSEAFAILGTTTDVPDAVAWRIGPCVPNPFNPRAEIRYEMPREGRLRLTLHDVRGRQVAVLFDGWQSAGTHAVVWDGREAASGVYFVRGEGPTGRALLKVTLVR